MFDATTMRNFTVDNFSVHKNQSILDHSEILDESIVNANNLPSSLDEQTSNSYKAHSNNSPDDLSLIQPKAPQKKQLKWILVNEPSEQQIGNSNSNIIQTPQIKNHTATLYNKKLYIFGGYDGKKNHCNLRVFDTELNCW